MTALLARPKLGEHPFVAGAPPEFIEELAHFEDEVEFKEGDILIREHEYASTFYLILEGEIAVEISGEGTKPSLVQKLRGGDVLGWSWLYPPYMWHFTARVVKNGKAIAFNAPALVVHAEQDPKFGYQLMKRLTAHLIQRLKHTCDLLHEQEAKLANAKAQPEPFAYPGRRTNLPPEPSSQ